MSVELNTVMIASTNDVDLYLILSSKSSNKNGFIYSGEIFAINEDGEYVFKELEMEDCEFGDNCIIDPHFGVNIPLKTLDVEWSELTAKFLLSHRPLVTGD